MKHNLRRSYLLIAAGIFAAACIACVCLVYSMFSRDAGRELSDDLRGVIERTAERTGNREAAAVWEREIASGRVSLSEYVRISFTGTQYLLEGKDDGAFAKDLSFAVYGNEDKAADLTVSLAGYSRVYVAEAALREINPDYVREDKAAPDKTGTRLLSVTLDQPLADTEGYGFGIRKASGQIELAGDASRTDFYIDGNLRPVRFNITEDASGQQTFSMDWDTRKESPGTHSVKILLRTSDGRAVILSGGDILIPSFSDLENDSIVSGSVEEAKKESWYRLDAGDQNAYINFVNATGDIKVTLYDMYGNRIGTNDLPGITPEVLRGYAQAISETDAQDPYAASYGNLFYARVERGASASAIAEITYLMAQTKEVAVDADGNYLAVTSDVGVVPTPLPTGAVSDEEKNTPVACRDSNGNSLTYAKSDLKFLPLNGNLVSLSFSDTPGGGSLPVYPIFAQETKSYGYVSAAGLSNLAVAYSCTEGYAASVTVENVSDDQTVTVASGDGTLPVTPSGNTIRIRIKDFDQNEHVYTLYLLSGADKNGYDTTTLNAFPESYRSGIWLLHNLSPAYTFVPYETGISWTELMAAEDNKDKSLVSDTYNPEWVKAGSPVYDGSSWRSAKAEVVSYFLDPRNFLTPVYIFQFENLSFNPAVHTIDGVKSMTRNSFLDGTAPDYSSILLEAGSGAGISPYFLTSRILQEMGRQGDSMLSSGTLPGYEGYYNFYNIGSTPDPDIENGALINGAKFAMWGSDAAGQVLTDEEKAILLPWTSADLAIKGGALWIAASYVDIGQNTLYFQKFDVINNEDGLYLHQYAQNIAMAYSESSRYFRAYQSQNMLASPFVFSIPVYTDMPAVYGFIPTA